MDRVPREVLRRHSIKEIGNFFGELLEKRMASGLVPVCIDSKGFLKFYFMPCDSNGYPKTPYMDFVEMDTPRYASVTEGEPPDFSTATFHKTSIYIRGPLISQQYYLESTPYPTVFMWDGEVMNRETIPIERLNVSELMKLAQETIRLREGLIIDEAIRNKLFI